MLVLPQINMPDLVGSPWEALSFLRRELEWVGRREGVRKWEEGRTVAVCKMNKKINMYK